jgi:hypothetical protein
MLTKFRYDEKEQEGLGMKKWALQSSVNPSDDAGSRIAFYKDRIGDPLYRIFIRMKSLKHIVVKAPHLTLRSNVFVIFSNDGSVRQPERWERDRAAQYGFLSSVFWAIAGARLRLEGFEFRGFDDPAWSPILAPSPTVLTSLRWDYQCYALLQRLHLQYDVHVTERSTFFLSVLDYTTKLKELNIELAGEIGQFSRVSNERISFICQVTTQLLTKLAPQPPFFLTHLELKGICANGEVTMDQVVRAHTSTLRILRLDDFWFLLPNSLRTFFEALANADVEYIGLRHFILANGRYLAQAVFWWLPTVSDLELEWEEEEYTMADIGMSFDGNNKKYEDEYCGQEDDETVEGGLKENSVKKKKKILANDNVANKILAAKDETFKDWVDFRYEKRGIDAWVEYGYTGNKRGTVKRAMREMVTSIDGGWLRL